MTIETPIETTIEAIEEVLCRAGQAAAGVDASPLIEILERVHAEFAPVASGEVATYIPELARADPARFGIAVATIDGQVFEIGDSDTPFTIQSISKPLVFGMALEERGNAVVLDRVGVEPSGNPFNAIEVEPASSRPFNPMVNAGAIVTTGLISDAEPRRRLDRIVELFGVFAGRELELDARVFDSERRTGDRNRALAWLMRSFGKLDGDVDEIVDLYFGQCSVVVTARDLAVMGATLANDGENPITGVRALGSHHVANVLSVMTTCGMYDNAGEWVYNVGLPAKSGVAGGLLAVLPGQLAIGVFSPPLDHRGNSVRGMLSCERLSRDLQLHLLSPTAGVQSVVRRIVRGDEIVSNRVRTIADEETIVRRRRAVALYELQGDLFFATAEKVHRTIVASIEDAEFVILDFRHVAHVDDPAIAVINRLAEMLNGAGRTVVAVHVEGDTPAGSKLAPTVAIFLDADAAVEWCEDQVLGVEASVWNAAPTALADFDLLDGLGTVELAAIELAVEVRLIEAGRAIFRQGDVADRLFFLLDGKVSVLLPLDERARDRSRRLATFGPGLAFGEMALLDEGQRSADVVCDEDSTVASLTLPALQQLDAEYPAIGRTISANLARLLARRLRAANAQIRALAR